MKERLDCLLVGQGLAPSREKAKTLIKSGNVYVNGQKADKPGDSFEVRGTAVEVRGKGLSYVSRGGWKLEKACESWSLPINGSVCMDIGASAGGFTDCMLQRGAAKVYAVDVGFGQLAEKLQNDSRVISLEKTNFRYLDRGRIPEKLDFACADVSFISLRKILPNAWHFLKDGGEMVCLIKPQFEAGKNNIGKNGVVRSPDIHKKVISGIVDSADVAGFDVLHLDYSPIRGPEGNIEYLLHLRKKKEKIPDPEGRIQEAWDEALERQSAHGGRKSCEGQWIARIDSIVNQAQEDLGKNG